MVWGCVWHSAWTVKSWTLSCTLSNCTLEIGGVRLVLNSIFTFTPTRFILNSTPCFCALLLKAFPPRQTAQPTLIKNSCGCNSWARERLNIFVTFFWCSFYVSKLWHLSLFSLMSKLKIKNSLFHLFANTFDIFSQKICNALSF